MIIWNGKDLIGLAIIAACIVFFVGAWALETIMFWLEKKGIISSKWRSK